jgi:hypothetical protein
LLAVAAVLGVAVAAAAGSLSRASRRRAWSIGYPAVVAASYKNVHNNDFTAAERVNEYVSGYR